MVFNPVKRLLNGSDLTNRGAIAHGAGQIVFGDCFPMSGIKEVDRRDSDPLGRFAEVVEGDASVAPATDRVVDASFSLSFLGGHDGRIDNGMNADVQRRSSSEEAPDAA